MSVDDAEEFGEYSLHLENIIKEKMVELAGNPSLSVEDMTSIIQMKINNGELTSSQVNIHFQENFAQSY